MMALGKLTPKFAVSLEEVDAASLAPQSSVQFQYRLLLSFSELPVQFTGLVFAR
jgi:hypothetical protein